MRVALADDSALFRDGLARLLEAVGIQVTAQASSGNELLALIPRDPPDVAILDIRMPPGADGGLLTAAQLRAHHPDVGILILSTYEETPYAVRVTEIGNHSIGYLLKDRVGDVAVLKDALERIKEGELVIDQGIVKRLLMAAKGVDLLTPREENVLRLMAEGRSNLGIARRLDLSPRTIEKHISELFEKLGIHPTSDDNPRVCAVITWLRTVTGDPKLGQAAGLAARPPPEQ